MVELVPEVVGWHEAELFPLAAALRADSRLRVIEADVYGRLAGAPAERYHLILVDVDHAPSDPLAEESDRAMFCSAEGLRRVARHLEPGGVLAVWSCFAAPDFEATLREVFTVVETETTVFVDDLFGEEDETNWLFFASGLREA